MKLTLKKDTKLTIKQNSVSIIANPNTNSKIILINPRKISLVLEKNSHLTIYSYSKNSKINKLATLEENSTLEYQDITFNTNIESKISLDGKKSSFINKSLSISTKDSSTNVEVSHLSKETKSSILNKCLVGKNSLVKCKGKIFIPKTSINCESHQKSESILINETSKCEASPILEIFNDQVSCSHSANISYLNKEKLFYLNSRGLNEKNATNLLLEAFAQTILNEVPESISELTKQRLKEVLK